MIDWSSKGLILAIALSGFLWLITWIYQPELVSDSEEIR